MALRFLRGEIRKPLDAGTNDDGACPSWKREVVEETDQELDCIGWLSSGDSIHGPRDTVLDVVVFQKFLDLNLLRRLVGHV